MPDPITALTVGGALIGSQMTSSATRSAAETQAGAAQAGIAQQGVSSQLAIDEQRRQFDAVQKILQPYVAAGQGALGAYAPYQQAGAGALPTLQQYAQAGAPALEQQQALLGLRGPEAERAAIQRISGGEQFKALAQQGEESLLQRASATGNLRGGNIQAALGQFRPALLSNLIEKQYGQLGGLAATGGTVAQNLATAGMGATGELARIGQASAAGVGSAGTTAGTNIGNIYGTQGTNIARLLGEQGAATAGGIMGQSQAYNLPGIFGTIAGRLPAFAPPVSDNGYSVGVGSDYGGQRRGF